MGVLAPGWLVAAGVLGMVAYGAARVEGQAISAPELTAAFLINFVKFTTWPSDVLQDDDPIVVCVIGNDRVRDALVQLTQSQSVNDHPLAVERRSLDRPVDGCHVIYGAGLDGKNAQWLIGTAMGRGILTVSDLTDFAQRGGVANFFIDGGRMRFAVNPAAAERARLRISSKLLTLAKVVRDDGGS
jgi:hypothetical protein